MKRPRDGGHYNFVQMRNSPVAGNDYYGAWILKWLLHEPDITLPHQLPVLAGVWRGGPSAMGMPSSMATDSGTTSPSSVQTQFSNTYSGGWRSNSAISSSMRRDRPTTWAKRSTARRIASGRVTPTSSATRRSIASCCALLNSNRILGIASIRSRLGRGGHWAMGMLRSSATCSGMHRPSSVHTHRSRPARAISTATVEISSGSIWRCWRLACSTSRLVRIRQMASSRLSTARRITSGRDSLTPSATRRSIASTCFLLNRTSTGVAT